MSNSTEVKKDKARRAASGVDILGGRMGLLVTPESCTGCRGCQVACKEWNKLPGNPGKNKGTHENPPDLDAYTYNKIRFVEKPGEKGLTWLFMSRRCLHCGHAACIEVCPAPGALYKTKQGAVAFNKSRCIACGLCQGACPFDVPRFDAQGKISKCDLCKERIANNMTPACAKTCPTGAISYGELGGLMSKAKKAGYETVYGADDLGGLGVMYAFKHAPTYYGLPASPNMGFVGFWKSVLKPLALVGLGASVAAAAYHYITIGPSGAEDGGQDK